MDQLDTLLQPLRHSPRLPEAVQRLSEQLRQESTLRQRFYREMTPDQKIEFVDGEVILHSPARNRHLDVTKYVAILLDTFTRLHALGTVKVEKCLCVFPRNDYEPDVVFFGVEKAGVLTADTLKFPVPDLIVEVISPNTEARDRGVKMEDYAANQVGEYWLLDPDKAVVEQYVLREGAYELVVKSSSGMLCSQVVAGFACDVEALFDEARNLVALREILSGDS